MVMRRWLIVLSIIPMLTGSALLEGATLWRVLAARLTAESLPNLTAFEAEIVPAESLAALRGTFLNRLADLEAYGGDRSAIPAIRLKSGVTSLRRLAAAIQAPDKLVCAQICRLHVPLYVEPGAHLVIEGEAVELESTGGPFLAAGGGLSLAGSEIMGMRGPMPALFLKAGEPRPFIVVFNSGVLSIRHSRLAHLGFDAPGAYGLSWVRHGRTVNAARPSGSIVQTQLHDLYYALYTYEAANLSILANEITQSAVYGIDPHDYSENILIAGNDVSGSGKHGIVLSKGVTNTRIIENRSHGNAGNGIVIDRWSELNVAADNQVWGNAGDGIAVYESGRNIIAHNKVWGNARLGIRVRGSDDVSLTLNEMKGNGSHAIGLFDVGERVLIKNESYGNRGSALIVR